MEDLSLLVDLHLHSERQGPGSDRETRRAIELAGLDANALIKVADIGCGTGASTLVLSRELNAHVTAVDFLPEFIQQLSSRAEVAGVADRISTLVCGMEELPFEENAFDLIWSEGAIYNMGFEAGVTAWQRFLKPGGVLVVSEISWTSAARPAEVQAYWEAAYPEIDTAAAKVAVLESAGYSPLGYFILPPYCWLDNYYLPLDREAADFLARHGHSEAARAVVEEGNTELDLYRRFGDYYSYGMYVARKPNVAG